MITRLKASLSPLFTTSAAKRDGVMIEDIFGVAALFALLFFALAVPASV